MKIIITSDHAGYKLKEALKSYFVSRGFEIEDLGPNNDQESCSYAEQGLKLGKEISSSNRDKLGVAVCGTGLGMSFAVNRFKGVRGARLTSREDAYYAKRHNDANVLIFGGRQIKSKKAIGMIEKFLSTEFEGGRHEKRIKQLDI